MSDNTIQLRLAMFMAIGAQSTLLGWSRLPADNSWLMDRFGGHTGLMDEVASYLPQLMQAYDAHECHPGVFEYEVAEVCGATLTSSPTLAVGHRSVSGKEGDSC